MAFKTDLAMTEEQVTSRINEAGNQVLRIGNLWGMVNTAATNGDLPRWNSILERIWSELSADAGEDQIKEFKTLNETLKALKINLTFLALPKSKRPSFANKIRDLQYENLMAKDYFLRKLQNLQGKGTLYRDEFEDDFE